MRVAIFSFEFPPETAFGGISTYSAQLADMLASRGHEVEVFAGGRERARTVRESGAIVHTCASLDQLGFAVPAAVSFLERHRDRAFDLIESPEYQAPALHAKELAPEVALVVRLHTPTALISQINTPRNQWRLPAKDILRQLKAAIAMGRKGFPLPSIHLANEGLRASREVDIKEKRLADLANLICSPSRALVSYPALHWNVAPEKCIHLPNMFEASEKLSSLPTSGRQQVLGFFGRLEERKGLHTLLQALPEIAKECPEVELCCVGQPCDLPSMGGPADRVLKEHCARLGIRLQLPGRLSSDQLPEWYGRCRVAVFPSIWENFPYVCLEAMAAGCAVVGSQEGGMADMIEKQRTGLLVPPLESKTLAQACITLLKNGTLSETYGTAARQQVLTHYPAKVLAPDYEKSYLRAMELNARQARAQRSPLP